MAWLLHEPRLRAEVPVFCVVAIKPLLRNSNAPMSVSVGAVQLLSHLHMRLEVLVKDDCEEIESGYDTTDTPVLWEVSLVKNASILFPTIIFYIL